MIPVNDDFQAVIFAGGKGSRMSQLLGGKPKCLLPIANKPMIAYPLEMLIRSEIKSKALFANIYRQNNQHFLLSF